MFNFLVSGSCDAWDRGFYEWEKGRILEYTQKNIASTFERLNNQDLETMISFPCLFAYEGGSKPMRLGRITNFKVRPRTVLIEFSFDQAESAIPFEAIFPLFELLDIRQWEMSRTHWAVKEENLAERLAQYNLISYETSVTSLKSKEVGLTGSPPPSKVVNSLEAFIAEVLSENRSKHVERFYRGHSRRDHYKLEPSLFRKDDDGNYLYLESEHLLYRELLVSNSADFAADTSTLDKLVRMQHYSLPTRLLDITSNPLIALYFACKNRFEEVGEVICFAIERSKIKYFDSDTASCIANLARLPHDAVIDFPQQLDRLLDVEFNMVDQFNKQLSIKRLVHFISEEKPFFESRVLPQDLTRVICVKGKKTNDRISSQSGAFFLFGQDATLHEGGDNDIRIKRIAISDKERILHELDLMNINESTVFPYIENSAKYVAKKFSFGA